MGDGIQSAGGDKVIGRHLDDHRAVEANGDQAVEESSPRYTTSVRVIHDRSELGDEVISIMILQGSCPQIESAVLEIEQIRICIEVLRNQ